ncbi:cold-shock protein [Hufsiella ginkgonis]|uniref:Cold shock domain-containing protein n=1 Tax=Hufsiella ginkgonis TaxID=2695274 RepID=A0A7K1XYV1_9SPHI|nr:cold shock domain-containing protein [Hufsiella ginkgonis]MXV15736.1 cold shock domain-containing protein [Hufsiella ginkgonis]
MGKSTETFGKKEKEKKRLKKQQEKKEKAEERKNTSSKGKGLDDMLAYVDEDGNISSTPPDPFKKKKIDASEIQIGVAKRVDEPAAARTGTITFFNEAKGYGFIKDLQSQESVFVHINALTVPVKERDKVTFETESDQKGLHAINVRKI